MPHGLVYYPHLANDALDQFRRRYDPTVDLIAPHLGLMFLIPDSIGESVLVRHLNGILQRWRPFPIRIHGLTKSWDHWLFLTLEEGNAAVVQLYDEIYAGPIAEFRRDEFQFIPHVAIGLFARQPEHYDHRDPQALPLDERRYTEALAEAEQLGVDVQCVVDETQLIRLNDDLSRIVSSRAMRIG